ncbi:MAG TPA: 50S ribosomal protein L17 [Polyangia bacterium]|jgi:ribosomal protein L17|nr:50S ribosomal protein L17 [Polyangia bacterium]
MRHKRAGLHLSRTPAHRKALFSNLVAAVLTYERIRTTEAKAKEVRRLVERAITWARRLGPLLTKKPEKRTDEEKARVVHAMRMALRAVRDREAVLKLFEEIGPRYLTRHGGYTRIMKLGQRPGDAAHMSLLELIPAEGAAEKPEPKQEKGEKGKAKAKKEPAEKGKAKAKDEAAGRPKKATPRAAAPKGGVKKESAARKAQPSGATTRRAPRGRKGGGE